MECKISKEEYFDVQKYCNKLKDKYGNHTTVAQKLGLSQRHYRRIRNGHTKPAKQTIALIKAIVELNFV